MKGRGKIETVVVMVSVVCIVVALTINGTLAWFTSQIMSSISNIVTGNLNVQVNGSKENFTLNIRTDSVFPNEYIVPKGANDTSVTVKTVNSGSIDIFYTGNFDFNTSEILGYGLIFEEVKREVYNGSDTMLLEKYYIKNHKVMDEYELIKQSIDKYDVNGNQKTSGDNLISLNEWKVFGNSIPGINRGYFVGALKPGCYEKWIYKIMLHKDCTSDVMANKALGLRYKIVATQNEIDAVKTLIKDGGIINVPGEMTEEDLSYNVNIWVNTDGSNLMEKQ